MMAFARLRRCWFQLWVAALLLVVSTTLAHAAQSVKRWPTTQVQFDPATQRVTLTVPLKDAQGDYFPDARPGDFLVYQAGARQADVQVKIERAAVPIAVLLEHGGRYETLNESIGEAVSEAARELLRHITDDESVAIWTYGEKVEELGSAPTRH